MGKRFVHNSFLGKREVIKELLNWKKSEFLLSAKKRFIVDKFGNYIVRIFGLPMVVENRLRYRAFLKILQKTGVEGKILDVGCGFGQFAFECARQMQTSQVVGIDISTEDIKLAKAIKKHLNIYNLSFIKGPLECNTFSDEEFDCIIMGDVLEHVQDDATVIGEVNRILKESGIIVVIAPYDEAPQKCTEPLPIYKSMPKYATDVELFLGDYHFTSGYNKDTLFVLFENHGFEVLHVSYLYAGMAGSFLRYLPHTSALFPLSYPLFLLPFFKKPFEIICIGKKIIHKGGKQKCNLSK